MPTVTENLTRRIVGLERELLEEIVNFRCVKMAYNKRLYTRDSWRRIQPLCKRLNGKILFGHMRRMKDDRKIIMKRQWMVLKRREFLAENAVTI